MTRRGWTTLMAALCLLPLWTAPLAGAEPERLAAALLTSDLGDPRAPGNLKLVVNLPEALARRHAPARAGDFSVYVYPKGREEGRVDESRRAGGLYLWPSGDKLFLDARLLPHQDREGEAEVLVRYHPDGGPVAAEGKAEGISRYAARLVDVILAVDVSSSMNYTDPNRRRVAAARSFIEMARQGGGIGRIGLVTFNSRARVNTPLVPLEQGERILDALNRVGANGMTSLDAPLRLGMKELAGGAGSAHPVIILLTDGRNEGSRYRDTHLECARAGVRLYTIGLTELADHALLMEMADATGGMYFRAPTDEDLPEIYARLAAELGKRRLLHAEMLRDSNGEMTLPIDATVNRVVATADGGARMAVAGPDDRGRADGRMATVHVLRPTRGLWHFAWEDAAPDLSAFALTGDTQFFLDVFPPQLYPGRLSVGATLAWGDAPLTGARVWLEPLPGVLPHPVELFDDGRHGDGEADDGVYGAALDIPPDSPEQFDVVFRAGGHAWDQGDFVRQASGLAIMMPEPPPQGSASLDGDVDFGVLFPGESGTALATIDLDSESPRAMHFELAWDEAGPDWPDLASAAVVEPGRRAFELEITVPRNTRPADYQGHFSISDGRGLGDSVPARVRVGTVAFAGSETIDLGVVPPGTFSSRRVALAYKADKDAPLTIGAEGDAALSVAPAEGSLTAGDGEIPVEVTVSVPLGHEDGEYLGRVRLRAGPGEAAVPVRWRVKTYAASRPSTEPLTGIPPIPALPGDSGQDPLAGVSRIDLPDPDELAFPAEPADSGIPLELLPGDAAESPWKKTDRVLRDDPDFAVLPPPPGAGGVEVNFPAILGDRDSSGGDSFWSAWWVYLLALLLLLILLLLLVAYILYRLGKSALARFLLVSGLANLILLALFLALLGTAALARPARPPVISVTLVADDYQPETGFSENELAMMNAPATPAAPAETAAGETAGGELALGQPSSGGSLLAVRAVDAVSPDSARDGAALARDRQPETVSLDSPEAEPLRRRVRRPERSSQPVTDELDALRQTAENNEQPVQTAQARTGDHPDLGERRLEIAADRESERPMWSDGERVAQPMTTDEGALLARSPGMEAVSLDASALRIDPRGIRRNHRERPESFPEPRVEIDDPVREAGETAAFVPSETAVGDPGIEEIRTLPRAMGPELSGAKPGAVVLTGVSRLQSSRSAPRGYSGTDAPAPSAPRGGPRSSRGGLDRTGSSLPNPSGGTPGALRDIADASPSGGRSGRGGDGGEVGEKRADDLPGGGLADAGRGAPDAIGAGKAPAAAGDGGVGPAPNPFAGGGDGRSDLATGVPSGQAGGGLRPGALASGRGADRGGVGGLGGGPGGRRRGGGNADMPGGSGGAVPGLGSGGGGPGDGQGGGGTGRGSGRGGTGEGRFDGLAALPGGGGLARRSGVGLANGLGKSRLDGGVPNAVLDSIPLPQSESEMRPDGRRDRRRSRAAASSSVEMDSLLLVVGDFARLPDSAAENLFKALGGRLGDGMAVEERRLTPGDANLADCLLAVLSPEEARDWSDDEVAEAGRYLREGGHIWMDAARPEETKAFMERLANASGGRYGPLPATHQLAEYDAVDAVTIDGKVAAVSTAQNWRSRWRYGEENGGGALRFLVRGLNYFLSGNADTGLALKPEEMSGDRFVEPSSVDMPEHLAGADSGDGRVLDDFSPDSAASWRMPGWSDPGGIASVSDGMGGRALKLDAGGAVKGRAAVYRTLRPPEDFSRERRLTVDIYYDGTGDAALSMVFTVPGQPGGWEDYETPPLRLDHGWNNLTFMLDQADFRPLATGGDYAFPLPGAERVGRTGFFLYRTAPTPATVLLRDIRLHER